MIRVDSVYYYSIWSSFSVCVAQNYLIYRNLLGLLYMMVKSLDSVCVCMLDMHTFAYSTLLTRDCIWRQKAWLVNQWSLRVYTYTERWRNVLKLTFIFLVVFTCMFKKTRTVLDHHFKLQEQICKIEFMHTDTYIHIHTQGAL